MGNNDALMLFREIRDLVQVLVVRQSPELLDMLRTEPSISRPSKSWTCGHFPEDDSEMDQKGQM